MAKIFVENGEKLVASEMAIFGVFVKWLDAHGKDKELCETLLSTIRYHMMSHQELVSIVYNSYIVESDKCRKLIETALRFSMAANNEKPIINEESLEPRADKKSFVVVASRYAAHPEFDSNVYAIEVSPKKEVLMYALSPMPVKRRGTRGVQVNGYLYVCGGVVEEGEQMDRQCVKAMHRYCSLSNTWQELAPMSIARAYHAVMYREGKIVVAGGIVQGQPEGWNWRLDWQGKQIFADNETMPFDLATGCGSTSTASVEEYDLVTNTWHRLCDLPQGVCYATGCSHNNQLYITGGKSNYMIYYDYSSTGPDSLWPQGGKQVSNIMYTSQDGSDWTEEIGMHLSAQGHCAVSSGTEMLIVGGGKGPSVIYEGTSECSIDHVTPGKLRPWDDFAYYQNEGDDSNSIGSDRKTCKLASPNFMAGAACDNGSLYIIGGHGICESSYGFHCCKYLKQSELLQIYDIESKTFTKVRLPFDMNDIVLGHMKLPHVVKQNTKTYPYEEMVHKPQDEDDHDDVIVMEGADS